MSQLENVFSDIANSIRTKLNTANTYTPGQMASAIGDIPSYDVTKYTTLLDGIMDHSLQNLSYEGHTNVGTGSFNNFQQLTDVNLPNVQTIGIDAFYNCGYLQNVNLPNVTFVNNSAFERCWNIRELNMPKLETANKRAFNMGYNLRGELNLPSLVNARSWSFEYCNNVTDFILPNLVNAEEAAFAWDNRLVNFYAPNLTNIGPQLFYECDALSNFYAPNLHVISQEAFFGCDSLTDFDFSNITYIDRYAFRSSGIGNINIGLSNNIGASAFQYCNNIIDASFPNLVKANGSLLYRCTNLVNVYMPNVVNADSEIFRECNNLINVYLPNLEWVSNGMFEYSTNLSILDFPKVNALNDFSFYDCKNLNTLILRANEVCNLRHSSRVFYNTPFNGYKPATLYVPNDLIPSYQSAANWSTVLATANVSILPIEGSIYE